MTSDRLRDEPGAEPVRVLVQRLDPGVPLPAYALSGDAVLPTGLAIALPPGYAAFVHPRSGLAARAGLTLVNAPGTIDSGYRGEIKVIVINHDPASSLELRRGERIAQLVFQRVERADFVEVSSLPASLRGDGGHGSTGGATALTTTGGSAMKGTGE